MIRSTEIQMKVHYSKQAEIAQKVARIIADEYNWYEPIMKKEIYNYLNYISNTIWF